MPHIEIPVTPNPENPQSRQINVVVETAQVRAPRTVRVDSETWDGAVNYDHWGVATQQSQSSEVDVKVIRVYVRKGVDDLERRLSFRVPENMSKLDLIERGLAIDGNEAAFTIRADYVDQGFTHPDTGDWVERGGWQFSGPFYIESPGPDAASLTEALAMAQRELVKYLRERGYEPDFV